MKKMKDVNTLLKKYPEFFRIKERAAQNVPQHNIVLFGIECDDGWYIILKKLLSWLKFNVEHNDYPMILINVIKEKYGTLRIYYDTLPIEKYEWTTNRKDETDKEKLEYYIRTASVIDGAIDFAESMSHVTCESCGSTKDVTTEGVSWIFTRCKKCRENK